MSLARGTKPSRSDALSTHPDKNGMAKAGGGPDGPGSLNGHSLGNAGVSTRRVATANPQLEARVVRKLDFNLIPLLFVLYMLSFLDRSNIGNAVIAGLETDLNISSSKYQWLLTIFYISYIVFEWFTVLWKRLPPHIWAAIMVLGYGLISTVQAAATNWQGMMALRFLLGAFESGLGPAVPFYLSFFYLRHEIGFRIGLFLSAAPLATCFAGALAYGITSGHPGIAPWKVLFIVEGLPTVVMSGVTFFFLPDTPLHARFLTPEEKEVCTTRGVRQVGKELDERIGVVDWKGFVKALLDPISILTSLMYFSTNVGFSSLPVFLPTIISQMGFTPIQAQGLSAPPYFLAFVAVVISTFIADRIGQRGLTIIVLSVIGAVGYIMLATSRSVAVRYTGTYLAAIGVFPSIINVLPWSLNNQGSDSKRAGGIVALNLIGQCGPLLGTRVYPGDEKPYYKKGMWTCAAFMMFNILLALTLRTFLVWKNKRLDSQYGRSEGESNLEGTSEKVAEENEGPRFRYVL